MEPAEALRSVPSLFDEQLTDLIESTLHPTSPPPTDSSPSFSGHYTIERASRKRSRPDGLQTSPATSPRTPAKRIKFQSNDTKAGHESLEYGSNVHPSRRVLLDKPAMLPNTPKAGGERSKLDNTATFDLTREPPRAPRAMSLQNGSPGSTWSTLANSVQRQWDPRKEDLNYEELLRHRRAEKLKGVDRYVPGGSIGSRSTKTKSVKSKHFRFEQLPEAVRTKIFDMLLISSDPITMDFTWLRPFVKGHARVPVAMQKLQSDDATFLAPVPWNKLVNNVESMQDDMRSFQGALEKRGECKTCD